METQLVICLPANYYFFTPRMRWFIAMEEGETKRGHPSSVPTPPPGEESDGWKKIPQTFRFNSHLMSFTNSVSFNFQTDKLSFYNIRKKKLCVCVCPSLSCLVPHAAERCGVFRDTHHHRLLSFLLKSLDLVGLLLSGGLQSSVVDLQPAHTSFTNSFFQCSLMTQMLF